MKRSLLLTCLLTLAATFGFAKDTWPITLTSADGLPGPRLVQNYVYKSPVYTFDEATSILRFTVCSTSTVDSLTTGSNDGFSAGWGTGIPFFTLSELRIFGADGAQIDYIASTNSLQNGDGGGLAVLNDSKENNHFHSVYNRNTERFPYEYHYIELELAEPVSTFSFNWNTRSGYHKNLITYMGITPGTQYTPFPEQEFELGDKVTSVDELAEEGALFVLRADAEEPYANANDVNPDDPHMVPVDMFFHAPYGGTVTPSAADLVYFIPTLEGGYKVCWLNNGHYILNKERHTGIYEREDGDSRTTWLHWTNEELSAASMEFTPSAEKDGNFELTMNGGQYIISYDGLGKMVLVENIDEAKAERSRPNTYHWSIYKASINGAAIKAQLQVEIDEAKARIAAVGGLVEDYDAGEYETLCEVLAEAEAYVADPEVSAANILNTKRALNKATAAYAAVGIWVYVDSIQVITDLIDAGEISVCEGPDWEEGAYAQGVYDAMLVVQNDVQTVIEQCQSLADVDVAIAEIYAAIDAFWASKVSGVKELPFRIGTVDDGLPGTWEGGGNGKGVWIWESPTWLFTEPIDAIRLTVFKNHSGRSFSGKPFVCINEVEFYDQDGNKIPLTANNFYTTSIAEGDGAGLAGLVDGGIDTDTKTHFHSQWGGDDDFDGSEYFYLDVTFPYEVSGFKYKQIGRGNGYDDVPTDFAVGYAGETLYPEDVEFPDPNNTQLGEQITDASQITDDGFYALVGLINCAPEGDGSGYEKFYSSNKAYGSKLAAPCAFTITSTGDEDGTFYIRSLNDSKYWSSEIDNDGWSGGSVTSEFAKAGKFHIVPNAEARAAAEKEEFENTFAIYLYNDTVARVNVNYSKANDLDTTVAVPHPYVVVQDWNGSTGYFSVPDLTWNDFDGEGEWYIYKMTMDNPYVFWLKNVVATAAGFNLVAGPDPGFYNEATVGQFANAIAAAQTAIETKDDAAAKAALLALEATQGLVDGAELNPMVPGIYVIESANANFLAQKGVKKAVCTYYNDYEDKGATSIYNTWWTNAPEDLKNAAVYYQFEFISATEAAQVQQWVADSVITAEQAANAYFIRSVEIDEYIGTTSVFESDGKSPERSRDINFTANPEQAYIVRAQGAYKFDLWNPNHSNTSLHMEGNSGGGGDCGDLVYWSGTDISSQWHLRYIADPVTTGIDGTVAEGDAVSVSYYTVAGVKVAAPVKGEVTIVKTVYADGAVKTSKVFVK